VVQHASYVWTFSFPKLWGEFKRKLEFWSYFFTDFSGESLFYVKNMGDSVNLWGLGNIDNNEIRKNEGFLNHFFRAFRMSYLRHL